MRHPEVTTWLAFLLVVVLISTRGLLGYCLDAPDVDSVLVATSSDCFERQPYAYSTLRGAPFQWVLFVFASLRLGLLGFQVPTNANHNLAAVIAIDEVQVYTELLAAGDRCTAPRGSTCGDVRGCVLVGSQSHPCLACRLTRNSVEHTLAELKQVTRLAVVGDCDFTSNALIGVEGNLDLFLNTINWVAGEEDLIGIQPRGERDQRFMLTVDQQRYLRSLSVAGIPALVMGLGVCMWWKRKT